MEIPGYKIVDTLGEGGMATVYLAIQESFEREVALKVMSPQLSKDPSFGERFIREARIVSRLMHPNIVTVYDVGVHNGNHYLSMEYVPGEDLKACRYNLELDRSLAIVKDVAKALDYAGRKGYVHRDVKPENIMIHAEDGRAVLMDFGIARASDAASGMTQTGTTMGTPHYMSPEQAKGAKVDPRSDLYSLGVVLFQLICGFVPFDADSAVAVGIMHVSEPIPQLPEHLAVFQPIIDKALAKKPDLRYQNGAELIADLEAIAAEDIERIKAHIALTPKVDDADESAATVVSAPIANTHVEAEEVARASRDEEELVEGEGFSVGSEDGIGYRPQDGAGRHTGAGKTWLTATAATLLLVAGGWFIWQQGEETSPAGSLSDTPVVAISVSGESVEEPGDVRAMIRDGLAGEQHSSAVVSAGEEVNLAPPAALESAEETLAEGKTQELLPAKNLEALRSAFAEDPKTAVALAEHYRRLLDSEEGAQAAGAQQGLEEVARSLELQFEQALQQGDLAQAESLADIAAQALAQPELDSRYRAALEERRQRQHIERLLTQADQYLQADALSSPAGANALETYRAVLQLEPENARAVAGLAQIAGRYLTLAKGKLAAGDLDAAVTLTERGLTVDADHAPLQSLKRDITQRQQHLAEQQRRIVELSTEAEGYIARNRLIAPRGESAFDTYQRLQEIPGAQDRARQGLALVEQALIKRIDRLLQSGALDEALLQLDSARDRFPQSEGLLTQRLQLDQLLEAQQPRVSQVRVAAEPMSDLSQPQMEALTPDRVIYIGFEYANFSREASVVQAILTDGSRSVQIAQKPVIVSGTQGVHFFSIERPVTGFDKGAYHVELKLGDSPLASVAFKVAE